MRKRYQSGGAADLPENLRRLGADMGVEGFETFALDEPGIVTETPLEGIGAETSLGGVGALDPSMMMMLTMSEAFGRTTTPEAKMRAEEILNQFMDEDRFGALRENLLQGKRDQAEQVRQALRTARERLMGQRPTSRAELLLGIGRGLGAPTRSGAIGETASNVAGQLAPLAERTSQFRLDRDQMLEQLDLLEAQADAGVLDAQFQLDKLQEEIKGRLAVEAMDTLGKSTTGLSSLLGSIVPPSAKALDAEYVKEYVPFIQGGSARAARGLAALEFAERVLESGVDNLTGPYLGAVASIPLIGRWLQAYASPEGADIRDLIEETIQGDLRPTLGSQFTESEGQRLIERAYNPNLEEWRNARRIRNLRRQLQEAYDNKVAMADWYTQYGTLFRYPNLKIDYTADDFSFDEGGDDEPTARRSVQYSDLPVNERLVQLQVWREKNPGREPPAWMFEGLKKGGPVRRYRKGGRVRRYQEGGVLFDEPEGVEFEQPRDRTLMEDLADLWTEYQDPAGMVLGGLSGLGVNALIDNRARRMAAGADRYVIDAIRQGGLDPARVASDIARNRGMGVPETLMDTDVAGLKALGEEAFMYGDDAAERALRELRGRLEGHRDRTTGIVNRGLKPDDFFDYDLRLAERLTGERREEMGQVFKQYPQLGTDPVIEKILQTPEGQKAVGWAMRFYQNDPSRPPVDVETMIQNPSLEFLDLVRKGFNQTIGREEKSGPTEFGELLRNLRKTYLDRLDSIAPEYQTAREAQGDDLEIRDSLREGRNFQKYQPEELQRLAKSLPYMQRDAFRTGIAQKLFEMIDASWSENPKSAQRVAGSPDMLARLEPFFDHPYEFEIFQTALEREAEIARSGREMLKIGESARLNRERTRKGMMEYLSATIPGFRFAISPVGMALRIMRDLPTMTPKEAERVLAVLRKGTPEEMANFARKARRLRTLDAPVSRWGRRGAAAAIGAGIGALVGDDEPPQE